MVYNLTNVFAVALLVLVVYAMFEIYVVLKFCVFQFSLGEAVLARILYNRENLVYALLYTVGEESDVEREGIFLVGDEETAVAARSR